MRAEKNMLSMKTNKTDARQVPSAYPIDWQAASPGHRLVRSQRDVTPCPRIETSTSVMIVPRTHEGRI